MHKESVCDQETFLQQEAEDLSQQHKIQIQIFYILVHLQREGVVKHLFNKTKITSHILMPYFVSCVLISFIMVSSLERWKCPRPLWT
jgi:hypothetical protein